MRLEELREKVQAIWDAQQMTHGKWSCQTQVLIDVSENVFAQDSMDVPVDILSEGSNYLEFFCELSREHEEDKHNKYTMPVGEIVLKNAELLISSLVAYNSQRCSVVYPQNYNRDRFNVVIQNVEDMRVELVEVFARIYAEYSLVTDAFKKNGANVQYTKLLPSAILEICFDKSSEKNMNLLLWQMKQNNIVYEVKDKNMVWIPKCSVLDLINWLPDIQPLQNLSEIKTNKQRPISLPFFGDRFKQFQDTIQNTKNTLRDRAASLSLRRPTVVSVSELSETSQENSWRKGEIPKIDRKSPGLLK